MNKREKYLNWQEFFIALAQICAMRSKDPNRQVGAVIVGPLNKEIISTGYNGLPRGLSDDKYPWVREGEWKDTKYPYVVHAETNAVVNAKRDLSGCHIYITSFPCNECTKLIIQSGITSVFFSNDVSKQNQENLASERMLKDAKINTYLIKPLKISVEN